MADIREDIELYALGKLSGAALDALEARMAADPAFAAEVAREVELIRAIRLQPEVAALRARLRALDAQPPQRTAPLKILLALVLLLIALALGYWLFLRAPEPSASEVFAAHFHPPAALPLSGVRRGAAATLPAADSAFLVRLAAAGREYESGRFEAALAGFTALQALPEAAGYADLLAYCAGLASLQSGQPERAIAEFERIGLGFPTEKPWYLALARLRAGQTAAARAAFEAIAASDSPFAAEAQEVLEEMGG